MDASLVLIQFLNGMQLGVLLFLLASGLTLTFGIMDFVNLAHGSLYMIGAFFCASITLWTGSFLWGILLAFPCTALVGLAIELVVIRNLYARDHLDHVLATFGLILVFAPNSATRTVDSTVPADRHRENELPTIGAKKNA